MPRWTLPALAIGALIACRGDERGPPVRARAPVEGAPARPPRVGPHPGELERPPPAWAGDAPCATDDDCVLLPLVTCCDECAPAPPFEVGARWQLDQRLLESEERCLRDPRPCDELPACPAVPAGCAARAACEDGRCVVAASGCGRPET